MRDFRSLKDKYPLPYPEASQASKEIRQQAQEAGETARDKRAQTYTILSHTRQLIQKTEETVHHTKARREYEAEQGILRPVTASQAGIDILFIEDDSADVALFRYVFDKYALSCQLTVLSQRSDVEAFFTQAATAALLSFPRLIITDAMIPGMEAEEIVAAVRAVPAYQRVPIILCSTLPEDEGHRLRAACGATMFVQKPNEVDALVRRCLRWCAVGGDGSADVTPANLQ